MILHLWPTHFVEVSSLTNLQLGHFQPFIFVNPFYQNPHSLQ